MLTRAHEDVAETNIKMGTFAIVFLSPLSTRITFAYILNLSAKQAIKGDFNFVF